MENYYDILELTNDCTYDEILISYKKKIKKFNNLPYLTNDSIQKIKSLKRALFVLTDSNLINLFNKILSKNNLNDEIKNREKTFNNHLISNRIWDMPRIPKN